MANQGRPKGTPKTGGRKKGTPNRVTADLREWLAKLIVKNKKQIASDLSSVEPKERLQMLEKLMQYVIPKQQAVTADVSLLTDEEINEVTTELLNSINDDGEDNSI